MNVAQSHCRNLASRVANRTIVLHASRVLPKYLMVIHLYACTSDMAKNGAAMVMCSFVWNTHLIELHHSNSNSNSSFSHNTDPDKKRSEGSGGICLFTTQDLPIPVTRTQRSVKTAPTSTVHCKAIVRRKSTAVWLACAGMETPTTGGLTRLKLKMLSAVINSRSSGGSLIRGTCSTIPTVCMNVMNTMKGP